MNLMLSDVIWIGLLITAGMVWWHGQGVKAQALKQVKLYCDKNNLQLLDESLVLRKVWLARNQRGAIALRRTYFFEFTSTGEYRYRGTVTLLGYTLTGIDTQTHHLQ